MTSSLSLFLALDMQNCILELDLDDLSFPLPAEPQEFRARKSVLRLSTESWLNSDTKPKQKKKLFSARIWLLEGLGCALDLEKNIFRLTRPRADSGGD
jgi:hypothetical protein